MLGGNAYIQHACHGPRPPIPHILTHIHTPSHTYPSPSLLQVVILPLQRPELFTRGSLTKPTKGLLLFGPPGGCRQRLGAEVSAMHLGCGVG